MINKLALFVTHNIFLTNSQMDQLINNESISTTGVCVPVWLNAKTTKTTEPAAEFFCEYEINNDKNKEQDIEILENKGYKINLPNKKLPSIKSSSNLSSMSYEERIKYEDKMNKWWKKHGEPENALSLQKTGYMRVVIQKLDQEFELENSIVDVQHIIEIKTIESLIDSIT